MGGIGLYKDFVKINECLSRSFRNRSPLVSVGSRVFTTTDIIALGIQSKTNMYFIGSRGSGKTLLAETIRKSVFGDSGFYLRGDVNLQLKDLFIKLDLMGKTEEEIYRISDAIKFKFALIDELNRVPGVLQNQFLNIADGYIEIRGKKYLLGTSEYMLMAATGNPPSNGEYTGVFDEDLALLDRIPLIINTDETPLEKGDIFAISEKDIDKSSIISGDLSDAAVKSYECIKELVNADSEVKTALALLKEVIYNRFRYVTISNAEIDKAQKRNWRDVLKGQHSGGSIVSYCSDISIRTLQNAGKLSLAMYEVAGIETGIVDKDGIADAGIDDFISTYLSALKLALNYDRRFISPDLPEQLGKTHAEMINTVFDEISGSIDPGRFSTAVVLMMEFSEMFNRKNENRMVQLINYANQGTKNNPLLAMAVSIMESKLREKRETERSEYVQAELEGDV